MTFSLVGRCARTGMFGAAVTTSAIAVGARCAFARAGVGAALTQHRTDPRLGPLLLDLLERGDAAEPALRATVAAAPQSEWRQVAVIDARGATAAFTGSGVSAAHAGEAHGHDCVAIANIVRSRNVPTAMIDAFAADPAAPLAARLVAALAAGEAAGGEYRPLISAALLVVHTERFPYVDLRVDAHADPIAELGRLWSQYQPDADAFVRRARDPGSFTSPPLPPPE